MDMFSQRSRIFVMSLIIQLMNFIGKEGLDYEINARLASFSLIRRWEAPIFVNSFVVRSVTPFKELPLACVKQIESLGLQIDLLYVLFI